MSPKFDYCFVLLFALCYFSSVDLICYLLIDSDIGIENSSVLPTFTLLGINITNSIIPSIILGLGKRTCLSIIGLIPADLYSREDLRSKIPFVVIYVITITTFFAQTICCRKGEKEIENGDDDNVNRRELFKLLPLILTLLTSFFGMKHYYQIEVRGWGFNLNTSTSSSSSSNNQNNNNNNNNSSNNRNNNVILHHHKMKARVKHMILSLFLVSILNNYFMFFLNVRRVETKNDKIAPWYIGQLYIWYNALVEIGFSYTLFITVPHRLGFIKFGDLDDEDEEVKSMGTIKENVKKTTLDPRLIYMLQNSQETLDEPLLLLR